MAHEASGQMSPKKKKSFWGSASSKFVFPDWACVKFRQQRFLEHYDEAKPPWGSWAILLFKVWTGAAFICHCILHRSVCSSLCVALFHSVFLTLWFWWPNTWMSVLLECICHHLTFFFYVVCLFILKTGSKTQRLPFCLMLCKWKFLCPAECYHWNNLVLYESIWSRRDQCFPL